MYISGCVLGVSALAVAVLGLPCSASSLAQACVSVLHKFRRTSWAENLAVHANGKILISRPDSPSVWQVDPSTGEAVLVYAWKATEYSGRLGISETTPDVFYVTTAAFFNNDFVKISGVNSVFKIDMHMFDVSANGGTVVSNATVAKAADVTVAKAADVTDADLLHGMATLDSHHAPVPTCTAVLSIRSTRWRATTAWPLTTQR